MAKKDATWLGSSDAARGFGPRNTHGWSHQSANKYNTAFNGGKK